MPDPIAPPALPDQTLLRDLVREIGVEADMLDAKIGALVRLVVLLAVDRTEDQLAEELTAADYWLVKNCRDRIE